MYKEFGAVFVTTLQVQQFHFELVRVHEFEWGACCYVWLCLIQPIKLDPMVSL